jgi:predicted dehydrogenase
MCGHTFLYSPPVRKVKQLIDAGELGELYFISSRRVNLGPYRSDVSVISDLGPHDFSILLYWLGQSAAWVSAVGRDVISQGIADVAFVDISFPDGLLGHVELSWLAPSKLRRTVLVGSEKMLVYEDGQAEPVRIFDSGIEYRDPESYGEYHLSYRTGDIVSPRVDSTEPIVAELEDFVEAIATSGSPESSPWLAVEAIRLVEAAESSMADSGHRVAVDAAHAELT